MSNVIDLNAYKAEKKARRLVKSYRLAYPSIYRSWKKQQGWWTKKDKDEK